MSHKLATSSQKVQRYLEQNGLDFEVVQLADSTRTAKEAAAAIGCEVSQIAKSLVFKNADSEDPVLVIASGSNRVSAEKILSATGITLAKADAEYVKQKVGFTIGGIPPVAHKSPLLTLIDQDLNHFSCIWAAAGTPFSVFRLTPDALYQMTQGKWLDIAE